MNKRITAFILVLSINLALLAGCYDRIEIDELTYIIAIGLDKGKTQPLKITFQFAISKAIGGGSEGGGGGGDGKPLKQITLEAPTIPAGLNMANGFIGKQMNMSHAEALIISEELAREDISPYMHATARYREFRPNIFIAICRGSAEEYLKTIDPTQEADPSKFYELIFSSYKYTGFIPQTQFFKFYSDMETLDIQPVAVLAGVNDYDSSNDFNPELNTAVERGKEKPLEGDYKAGQIPRVGEQKGELMGLAVFNGPKMVGELDGASATNYLMATGKYGYAYITIPEPKFEKKYMVLNVYQGKSPERKVEFVNGKPSIQVKINLEADFFSIQSGYNYESPENIPLAEQTANEFFEKGISTFLERTAKEFKSDICGFGREAKKQFLTWKDWEKFNWFEKYNESTFDVTVDLKIRRTGLIIRSNPFKTTKEKEGPE